MNAHAELTKLCGTCRKRMKVDKTLRDFVKSAREFMGARKS